MSGGRAIDRPTASWSRDLFLLCTGLDRWYRARKFDAIDVVRNLALTLLDLACEKAAGMSLSRLLVHRENRELREHGIGCGSGNCGLWAAFLTGLRYSTKGVMAKYRCYFHALYISICLHEYLTTFKARAELAKPYLYAKFWHAIFFLQEIPMPSKVSHIFETVQLHGLEINVSVKHGNEHLDRPAHCQWHVRLP